MGHERYRARRVVQLHVGTFLLPAATDVRVAWLLGGRYCAQVEMPIRVQAGSASGFSRPQVAAWFWFCDVGFGPTKLERAASMATVNVTGLEFDAATTRDRPQRPPAPAC